MPKDKTTHLHTVADIARILRVTRARVEHVIKSRGIEPQFVGGKIPLFTNAGIVKIDVAIRAAHKIQRRRQMFRYWLSADEETIHDDPMTPRQTKLDILDRANERALRATTKLIKEEGLTDEHAEGWFIQLWRSQCDKDDVGQ